MHSISVASTLTARPICCERRSCRTGPSAAGQRSGPPGPIARCQAAAGAGQSGRHGDAVRLLALSSLAWQAEGDSRAGPGRLDHALRLAQPNDMVRSFVDLGDPLVELLRQIPANSDVAGYAIRLLDAFSAGLPQAHPIAASSLEQPLVEPLSQRELEVLALIAQGLSNRQIADELIISIGTVKAHTSNIYGKLGVRSRTQAIVTARDLGITGQPKADGGWQQANSK